MITRKISLKVIVVLFVICLLSFPVVFAEEQNNENTAQEENKNAEELDANKKAQKEELLKITKELLDEMQIKLKNIDATIEEMRKTKEYETYPAIRLNMDTPLFGLASIVDERIKIKQDVSAADVAAGYSIRNIIKNRTLKLPDVSLAGIIVGTRDIKLDDSISLADASTAVLKLMQYTKNLDNTTTFLENQINKIFKGYIPKDKTENIADMTRRLSKMNSTLTQMDDTIISLGLLATDEVQKDVYKKASTTFLEYSKSIKEYQKKSQNILISIDDLNTLQRQVLELEIKMSDFTKSTTDTLTQEKENYNYQKMLLALKENLDQKQKQIDTFIEESVTKKEVETAPPTEDQKADDNIGEPNSNTDENQEQNTENHATVEEIKNYEVISRNLVDNLKNDIEQIRQKIEKYVPNEENQTEAQKEQVGTISQEERNQLLEEVTKILKDYIQKEDKFYLDNINYMLKNTTSRIADLSKYTESDILKEMRYVYLELPDHLERYLDDNNMNLYIEVTRLSENFHHELLTLTAAYRTVNQIYDELNVTEIKSKD